ncbi:hypothetical protein [Luteimonas aquatica]|uniref:hypothetical protein n=1 Tax=Luteimonas aquatica TaxID=450364 RepID=UPI001F59C922|nr:hypothetical protein [Luteimonas aquatica]
MKTRQTIDEAATDSLRLPVWLRRHHADAINAAADQVIAEAKRTGDDPGIMADRRVKAILAEAGQRNPSAPTIARYRRAYADMLAEGKTPADKATTFQHFNFLRSAWRYCEAEAIRGLRRQSEAARKAKDYARMADLTGRALQRATVFDVLFLQPDRPTWGAKAAALRAAGLERKAGKSKRAASRTAPTPDQLLFLLSQQRRRAARVEVASLLFACFGVRPQELKNGVRLTARGDALGLEVKGAKVDGVRGQPRRMLVISAERFGLSALAIGLLHEEAKAGRTRIQLTDADLLAVRRALREAQPGLSPYAYRHARASDAKAKMDRATAAMWLGHRTDRAQSYYGDRNSSSGAVRLEAAKGTAPVRMVKTLPNQSKRSSIPVTVALSAMAAAQRKAKPPRPWDYKPPTIPKAPKSPQG